MTLLTCDALPISCTVDLNLVEVMASGGASPNYSGTSVISFQVEEPTTCLFFHVHPQRVQLQNIRLMQGKHVLRPKQVYDLDAIAKRDSMQQHQQQQQQQQPKGGKASKAAAAAAAAAASSSPSSSPPSQVSLKDVPLKWNKTHTAVSLSESDDKMLLRDLPIADLRVIELPQPASYCVIDIITEFQSSVSDDLTGVYVATTRPAGTVANGTNLAQPTSLVATHFEVDHAHKSFPCVDFTFIRQTVKFNLAVPAHAYCRSNGGAVSEPEVCLQQQQQQQSSSPKGGVATKKESLPASLRPIPMYIACFIATTVPLAKHLQTVSLPEIEAGTGEHEQDEIAVEEVEFCVLTTYDSQFMSELAFKTLMDATRELRQFMHCALDLPQLFLFAAPKLIIGGMENDGFIFLKESLGVTNHSQPGQGRRSVEAATKELVRFTVHEVAHHWIGNRVGFSFAWKEGITLVLERYFGNVLLGLPPNQGSKGGSSTSGAAGSGGGADDGSELVQVDAGKELSGLTYHKAEAAMEATVRKMGWPAFRAGVQKIGHLEPSTFVPDADIASYFAL